MESSVMPLLPFEVVADLIKSLENVSDFDAEILYVNFKSQKTFKNIFRFIGDNVKSICGLAKFNNADTLNFSLPSEADDWKSVKPFKFNEITNLTNENRNSPIISIGPYSKFAYKEIKGEIPNNFEFFERIKIKETLKATNNSKSDINYTIHSLLLYDKNEFECILSIKNQNIQIFPESKAHHLTTLKDLFTYFAIKGILYERIEKNTKPYFKIFYDIIIRNPESLINRQIHNSDNDHQKKDSVPEGQQAEIRGARLDDISEINTTPNIDSPSPSLDMSISFDLNSPIHSQIEQYKKEEEERKKIEIKKEEKKIAKPEAEKLIETYDQIIIIDNDDEISSYAKRAFLSAFCKKNVELVYYDIKREQKLDRTWACFKFDCDLSNPNYMKRCLRCGTPRK